MSPEVPSSNSRTVRPELRQTGHSGEAGGHFLSPSKTAQTEDDCVSTRFLQGSDVRKELGTPLDEKLETKGRPQVGPWI